MTALANFLKEFSDVEAMHTALTAAKTHAGASQEDAVFSEHTPASVLNLLQSLLSIAMNGEFAVDAIKSGLEVNVRRLLKATAEEYLEHIGREGNPANTNYLDRASELVLKRFDTLLAMAKGLEKPGKAVSGERTEVLGHNPQVAVGLL